MKKIASSLLLVLLILPFLLSCTLNNLKHEAPLDDEVSRLLRNLKSADSYPDADVVYILEEKTVEVFEDARCKVTFNVIYKIINERGKDYADVSIDYNSRTETASILSARTITPEGKIIPLKKNATKVTTPFKKYPSYSDYKQIVFSMPGATVGSVIEYKAVIEEKISDIEGKFSNHYDFQKYNPTLLCRYKVITPLNMDLKYLLRNPLDNVRLAPQIIHKGKKNIYLWEYQNIPQIIAEDSMPPFEEVAFRILVTTIDSWEQFFNWWKEKTLHKAEPDEGIRRKTTELTKNLSTSQEKVEAIFDFVKREIRYVSINLGRAGYEPQSAPEVFENKYGDCKDKSTLLISMLKVAGIPTYYVLIPTHTIGNLIKDFPYPFQFNHCIVAVERDGEYHFLDPVNATHNVNYLPDADQNRDVLIFKAHQTLFGKTSLTKPEKNSSYTQQKITIDATGTIRSEVNNFSSGDTEAFFRKFFIDTPPTKIREGLEEVIDETFPGAKLSEYTHSDPLDFKQEFFLKLTFDAKNYCKKAGDILVFQLPGIEHKCSAKGKETRRYPIVFRSTSYEKEEAEFNIPEGYEAYHLPEQVEVTNPYFDFRSHYQIEGDKIFYRGELLKKAVQIAPEEYSVYQKSCEIMGKSFKRDVLFRAKK